MKRVRPLTGELGVERGLYPNVNDCAYITPIAKVETLGPLAGRVGVMQVRESECNSSKWRSSVDHQIKERLIFGREGVLNITELIPNVTCTDRQIQTCRHSLDMHHACSDRLLGDPSDRLDTSATPSHWAQALLFGAP